MLNKNQIRRMIFLAAVFFVCCFAFLPASTALAFNYNNIPATVVIGQQNFTGNSVNQGGSVGPNTLNAPSGIIVINGKLIVSDASNNRLLIFNSIPTSNNASADVIIGGGTTMASSTTFDRPASLATDGTKLFVADRDHSRILIYNQVPTTSTTPADVVIGQANMDADVPGTTANRMSITLTGVAYDSTTGKLLAYDAGNNRVLVWNSVPTTNDVAADVVIGQQNMTTGSVNQGGSAGANTLALGVGPGLSVTSTGKVLISDRINHRILIYNSVPTSNNASADVVIGQTNFSNVSVNGGGSISASGLSGPRGTYVDANGRLFVTEQGNARILIFNSVPTTNGVAANVVIGQPGFTTGTGSTTATTLATGLWNTVQYQNKFLVNDGSNQRILIFELDAPTIGAITSSSIRVNRPAFAASANENDYDWRARRNGTTELGLNLIATTSTIDTGLTENTQYSYDVQLDNGTSFEGDYSATASAYTLADNPTNLTSTTVSSSEVTVTVDPLTNDTVGSSGYFFSRNGANSGWIQTNTWTDTGISCGESRTYSVKYRNANGVETDSITYDVPGYKCRSGSGSASSAPILPSEDFNISVNNGAAETANPSVTLLLTGGSDTTQMMIANSPNFTGGVQEAYVSTRPWNLCRGNCTDGTYTVYAKFYNAAGVSSPVVSTSIRYKNSSTLSVTDEQTVKAIMDKIVLTSASPEVKQRIHDFIASGNETVKSLGAGERGSVINSFQAAYGHLPQSEADWADVIKIASGRWPAQRNAAADARAIISFRNIYGRTPLMSNARDNAAVTIMAYGLHPVPRNIASETTAIRHYRAIFKRIPSAASDWDIVRAIAYSGAVR